MAGIGGIILLANKLKLEFLIIKVYNNSIVLYNNTFNYKLIICETFIKDLPNIGRLLVIISVSQIGDQFL